MQTAQGLSHRHGWIVAGLLASLLFVTRVPYFHLSIYCANASMAVFFLGGLYVRRHGPMASLVLLAVAIDYVTIRFAGGDNYCISAAYGCLLLAYGVLWYGGRLLAVRGASRWMQFCGAWALVSLAFLISNGSFYWLGGRVTGPSLSGWIANFTQWAPLFIGNAMAYVGVVLLAHEAWERVRPAHPARHPA